MNATAIETRLRRLEAAAASPMRERAVLQVFGENGPSPTDAQIASRARAAVEAGTILSMNDVFVIQLVAAETRRSVQ